MPKKLIDYGPQFRDRLIEKLSKQPALKVEKNKIEGYGIAISDIHSGKCIYIEFRWAGEYGELPMGTIVMLGRQLDNISKEDKLFLVTFSDISKLLASKFELFGIKAFSKPSLDEVISNVQLAFSA
jgi:hypothetical protein